VRNPAALIAVAAANIWVLFMMDACDIGILLRLVHGVRLSFERVDEHPDGVALCGEERESDPASL
jgi:hypothetical protein